MFNHYRRLIEGWARDKNIHEGPWEPQFDKVVEEIDELNIELCADEVDMDKVKMEFGDIIVTLIILAMRLNIHFVDCLGMAWEKIRHRKGKTVDGKFIKEG